jgi:hypothetical protein
LRNFRHLSRYPEDIKRLGKLSWQSLQEGYFASAQLGAACESKLRSELTTVVAFDD